MQIPGYPRQHKEIFTTLLPILATPELFSLIAEKNLTPNGANGLKRKVSGDRRNLVVSLSENNLPESRLCYNQCGEIYLSGHKCSKEGEYQRKKESKRIIQAIDITREEGSPFLQEFERELDLICSKLQITKGLVKIQNLNARFNYAPILLKHSMLSKSEMDGIVNER